MNKTDIVVLGIFSLLKQMRCGSLFYLFIYFIYKNSNKDKLAYIKWNFY